jgi:hypothetical protein
LTMRRMVEKSSTTRNFRLGFIVQPYNTLAGPNFGLVLSSGRNLRRKS